MIHKEDIMRWRITLAVILALSLVACSGSDEGTDDGAGLSNPASVYCEEQGGTLQFRQDESGGTYGVCVFDDGSECEEWAFYRGECAPGDDRVPMTIDDALAASGPVTVAGYLFVDADGEAVLASLMAESFPPQAAGATVPVDIDVSGISFSEDQGLRWTDQMIEIEGTMVDGVLVGSLARSG
jgi:putative hemolysin